MTTDAYRITNCVWQQHSPQLHQNTNKVQQGDSLGTAGGLNIEFNKFYFYHLITIN